ncbi:uncharacterized protein B0I36DRAFT_369244 [Microdochium trichocladiopsis]|uniref:Uncharacterized protein n=1 Tax=Microdochium trichocladiopsis TaxID=1682393 RepID=A0A9P8XTX0_9PEZI|nr:uncharacterized protein B0I36DRAFT_369244 [Microdochium trichocladiopsis]KAH7014269.1 hypothetical protein B0I36DRAFT_369244 [Microdochium trichocladiopsis]
MTATFQFVDSNSVLPGGVDRETRRRIRSHAATGKNVGRKVNRPSKVAALKAQHQQQRAQAASAWDLCKTQSQKSLQAGLASMGQQQPGTQSHARSSWKVSSKAIWAFLVAKYENLERIKAQSHVGLDFVLPAPLPCRKWVLPTSSLAATHRSMSFFMSIRYFPELRSVMYNPATAPSIWLSLVFSDEAYFHVAMAASTLLLAQITDSPGAAESSAASMSHLSRTFQLISKKLTSGDPSHASSSSSSSNSRDVELKPAVSDATMAVVIMMAQYERHQGRWFQGLVHLRGLQRMVELRGGMARLFTENAVVGHKILRLDLEFSLHARATTYFRIEEFSHMLRTLLPPTPEFVSSVLAPASPGMTTATAEEHETVQRAMFSPAALFLPSLPTELRTIFIDSAYISDLINAAATASENVRKINLDEFLHTLLDLGYRLVQLRPLGAVCWAVDSAAYATAATRPRNSGHVHPGQVIMDDDSAVTADVVHLGLFAWLMRFMHRLDGIVEEVPRLLELVQRAAEFVLGPAPPGVGPPSSTSGGISDKSGASPGSRSWGASLPVGGQTHTPEATTKTSFSRGPDIQAQLVLWTLFLTGALGFQRRPYQPWVLVRIRQALQRLCLDDQEWEATRSVLGRYPWVHKLHGRVAEGLWKDALSLKEDPGSGTS